MSAVVNSNMDCFSLQPGQWVKITGSIYRVIEKIEFLPLAQPGMCWLMNLQGKIEAFCPHTKELNEKPIETLSIEHLSKENLKKELSNFDELEKLSVIRLKQLVRVNFFDKGFDPDQDGKILTGKEIRDKYKLEIKY
jgi:hypothetical protein